MAENNLYFIKFLSQDDSQKSYILFCALVNRNISKVEGFDAIVCLSSNFLDTPEYATYRDVSNKIQKLKFEGDEVAMSSTGLLIESFKNSFSSENYMIELMHYLEHENTENLKSLFRQNIMSALGNSGNPIIKMNVLLVSKEEAELSANSLQERQLEANKDSENSIPSDAIFVKYSLVLSPVSGKRLDELKPGDRVLIKLSADDDASKTIIDSLGLKEESGVIKNTPAAIVSAQKTDVGYEVVVRVSEGIYGKYIESDESTIKVKLAEETPAVILKEEEQRIVMDGTPAKQKQKTAPTGNNTVLLIGIGVIIIFLWIVAFFFIM